MSALNKVMLIGNVGKDPEIRYTGSGTAVCNFTVATNENWTDKASGEKKSQTEWHRIVVWGKVAESVSKFVSKGSKVYIEGKLQTREWTNKEGQKQWTTEINAQNVLFLDSKQSGSGGGRREEPPPGDYDDLPS